LEAAAAGDLDKALATHCSAAGSENALRQQAREALLDAVSSGRLDSVLNSVKDSQDAAGTSGKDSQRYQARQLLLDAARSGVLDEALKKAATQGTTQRAEVLRERAKQLFAEAAESGKLDDVLVKLRESMSVTTDLRQEVRNVLCEATSSGELEEALAQVRSQAQTSSSTANEEELRQQVQQAVLEAVSSGKLDNALASVRDGELQAIAKRALLDASSSGKLEEALGSLKVPQNKRGLPLEVAEDQRRVKACLTQAAENGRLEAMLAELNLKKGLPKKASSSGAMPLTPFTEYYQTNFRPPSASCQARALFSQDASSGSPPPENQDRQMNGSSAPSGAGKEELSPWLQKSSSAPAVGKLPLVPFTKYYQENFRPPSASSQARMLFAKDAAVRPTSKGGQRPTSAPAEPKEIALPVVPFTKYYQANFRPPSASSQARKLFAKEDSALPPVQSASSANASSSSMRPVTPPSLRVLSPEQRSALNQHVADSVRAETEAQVTRVQRDLVRRLETYDERQLHMSQQMDHLVQTIDSLKDVLDSKGL
jgi:hypothetical protein